APPGRGEFSERPPDPQPRDPLLAFGGRGNERHAPVKGEGGLLRDFRRDGDDEPVDELEATRHQVFVAARDWIEAAGVDRYSVHGRIQAELPEHRNHKNTATAKMAQLQIRRRRKNGACARTALPARPRNSVSARLASPIFGDRTQPRDCRKCKWVVGCESPIDVASSVQALERTSQIGAPFVASAVFAPALLLRSRCF